MNLSSESLPHILTQLAQRLEHAQEMTEFDQILLVETALKEWDGQGDVPYADSLRAWGLLAPDGVQEIPTSPPPTPTLTAAEKQSLLDALNRLFQAAPHAAEKRAIRQVQRALETWDGYGDLPEAGQLAAWGVWPLQVAPVSPPPPQEEETPLEMPPPQADPDDALQSEFEQAMFLVKNGQWYDARQALNKLRERATGRLQEAIEAQSAQVNQKLDIETKTRIAKAEDLTQKDAPLELQKNAWLEVIQFNPDERRAQEKLNDVTRHINIAERRSFLQEYRETAQRLSAKEDYTQLIHLLGQAKGTLDNIEAESGPDLGLLREAREVVRLITAERERLRGILGIVSTVTGEGSLESLAMAYIMTRKAMEQGGTIIDVLNFLNQGVDAEVPAYEFFNLVADKFLPALRAKTLERIEMARRQVEKAPHSAKETLEQARKFATGEMDVKVGAKGQLERLYLTDTHRTQLSGLANQVQEELEQVAKEIEKFDRAAQYVQEALRKEAASERLDLLRLARESYPTYPDLDSYEEQAYQLRAGEIHNEAYNAIASARYQMNLQDAFQLARDALLQARTQANAAKANIPDRFVSPRAKVDETLHALDKELDTLTETERKHNEFLETLKKVREQITAFDEKQVGDLRAAQALLDGLTETQSNRQETRQLQSELASRRSDLENWTQAGSEYAAGRWELAASVYAKIKAGAENYEEACKRQWRAMAATHVIQARQAEAEKDWQKAVNQFNQAQGLFDQYQSDPFTSLLEAECREAVQRLAPIAETDRQVRAILSGAREALSQARNILTSRQGRPLPQRLAVIPQFAHTLSSLKEAQARPTTLGGEIETLIAELSNEWRKAYLGPMQESNSPTIPLDQIQQAVHLGQALDENHLLYEIADRELYLNLQRTLLDQEYKTLKNDVMPDWEKLEANRRRRWEIDRLPEIRKQWGESTRARIETHVNRLARKENTSPSSSGTPSSGATQVGATQTAIDYLNTELDTNPVAQSDSLLIQRLIQLYWEMREWYRANQTATRFREATNVEDSATLTLVWQGLTQVASEYANENLENAVALIERLENNSPVFSDLIGDQDVLLREQAFRRLMDAARQAEQKGTDEDLLTAAERYAKANALQPDDPVLKLAMETIGKRLDRVITSRCEEATTLKLSGSRQEALTPQTLDQKLNRAQTLAKTLRTLQKVSQEMRLSADLDAQLTTALDILTPKIETWQDAKTQFDAFDKAFKAAIQTPVQDEETRGWDFDTPRNHYQTLQSLIRSERDLGPMAERKRETLEKAEDVSAHLQEMIIGLMEAIREENFEPVLSLTSELEKAWTQPAREGWLGLEDLLRYRYPGDTTDTTRLRDHRARAGRQMNNLKRWQDWATKASSLYKTFKERDRIVNKPLEDQKEEMPLAEIVSQCRRDLNSLTNFLGDLEEEKPGETPLSHKAQTEEEKIPLEEYEAFVKDVEARWQRIHDEAKQTLTALERVGGPLTQLDQAMRNLENLIQRSRNKPIAPAALGAAENKYQECREIDPLHPRIMQYRKRLNEIKGVQR